MHLAFLRWNSLPGPCVAVYATFDAHFRKRFDQIRNDQKMLIRYLIKYYALVKSFTISIYHQDK